MPGHNDNESRLERLIEWAIYSVPFAAIAIVVVTVRWVSYLSDTNFGEALLYITTNEEYRTISVIFLLGSLGLIIVLILTKGVLASLRTKNESLIK